VSDHGKDITPHGTGPAEEPIPNPGMHEHQPRPTDIDEVAEKRAERQIATFFGLSMLCAILFVVAYFSFDVGSEPDLILGYGASTVTLGLTLGLALLLIGLGAIQWARKLMSDVEIVEQRHPAASSEADRETSIALFQAGVNDSGIGRRPLIRRTMIGAMALVPLSGVVLLRDLGPLPGNKLRHTFWGNNAKLGVNGGNTLIINENTGQPLRPEHIIKGSLTMGKPKGLDQKIDGQVNQAYLEEIGKAAILLVRLDPDEIKSTKELDWSHEGIVAYSKICTHVGCPIGLYEQQTHHLLCPCHQSTFDLADDGAVVFGPAARSLPQLRIRVNDDGFLEAIGDFHEPVGPSFWERG
jgi:ubiquinol-cytochrome c reductase iron-sulfur subunit